MSGFAGVFVRTGDPADAQVVGIMAGTTPYRASAGEWTFRAGPFCVVRQMTRTTPEEHAERAPVAGTGLRSVIAFDGRLDNRDELISALEEHLARDPVITDAALALAAWESWGDRAPSRLLGDFAFVIWDEQRQRVFCARDPMGIRPLFYFLSSKVFVFGSEVRQVLAHPAVSRLPDERTIAGVLQAEIRDADRTLFRDVRRLPHAHALTVCRGFATVARYWHIDLATELRYRDDRQYAAGFREVFDRAVASRMRSAGPLGAYLSGGLDSSSVVTTARAVRPDTPMTAFSLVFRGDPRADEREYLDAVVRQSGVTSVRLEPRTVDVAVLREEVREGCDLPEPPNDMAGRSIRQAMAARRVRVALTGGGGDYALTGSYFHFAELIARGRFAALLRRGRDAIETAGFSWRDLKPLNHAVWPLLPVTVRRALRPLARRLDRPPHAPWIPRAFALRAGLLESRPAREIPVAQLARAHAMDAFESAWGHAIDERYQRGSLACGVEERHPFFDRRVIEFALALPDGQRWKNGQMKYVLRRAMAERLPEAVRHRPDATKADFSELAVHAVNSFGEAFFEGMRMADAGWVEPRVLAGMCRRMHERRAAGDPSYGDLAKDLWRVASLEIWYSTLFDAGTAGVTHG